MKQLAYKTFEKALNQYLHCGGRPAKALTALSGKCIALHLKRPSIDIFMHFIEGKIVLNNHSEQVPDTDIYTSFFQLVRMKASQKATVSSLQSGNFVIEGDRRVAEQLDQLFRHHAIDWEEQLSRFVGDALAHKVGRFARKQKRFTATTANHLQKNITEYLQEELRLLPTRAEVEDLHQSTETLGSATDRLEARLSALKEKIDASS